MCGWLFGSSGSSKMKLVKENSTSFVEKLHKEGRHFGAVSHFDNSYDVGTPRKRANEVTTDIESLSSGGGTALYDSIIKSVLTLKHAQAKGRRSRMPALLLTFTDGKENESEADLEDVRQVIRETGFTPRNRCYFAIAGIGDASQKELRNICSDGLGVYTHTDDDIEEAFKLFIAATLAVVKGRESYASMERNERSQSLKVLVRKFERLDILPMEYMLNIDASGSMSNTP
ncbi:vWA domain-containing protein [Halorussus ruber]|uniref:vWA domain-containing protein n=1 Tax=Halorussus ruber TaxID=1126238 RepID=UPI001091B156|nr:vWA domain-containing protein [Halorussus ruber]